MHGIEEDGGILGTLRAGYMRSIGWTQTSFGGGFGMGRFHRLSRFLCFGDGAGYPREVR